MKQNLEALLIRPIYLSDLRSAFDQEFHQVVETLYQWLREDRLIVERESKKLVDSSFFFFLPTDSVQLKSSQPLRVVTWNVNSVRRRLDLICQFLKIQQPSLIVLQETKTLDASFPHGELLLNGYSAVFHGQSKYNGVAVLANCAIDDVRYGFTNGWDHENKRLIAALVQGVWVINVYAPQGSNVDSDKFEYKLLFYEQLYQEVQKHYSATQPVILLGDLNIAPEARDLFCPEQMQGQVSFHPKELEALQKLKDWGLHDVFRKFHKSEGHYSWWDYRGNAFRKAQGMRIDLILATPPLFKKSQACWIDKAMRAMPSPSDHAPVTADFIL